MATASSLNRLNFSQHGVEIRKQLLAQRDIRFVAADISLESNILRSGGIRNLEKKFLHDLGHAVDAPCPMEIARAIEQRQFDTGVQQHRFRYDIAVDSPDDFPLGEPVHIGRIIGSR